MRCREFMERLIVVILESVDSTSDVSRGLCCLRPELMLEGEDHAAFDLFSERCRIFITCGTASPEESKVAQEEYTSYVIEKRRHHTECAQSAGTIRYVMDFQLRDWCPGAASFVVRAQVVLSHSGCFRCSSANH